MVERLHRRLKDALRARCSGLNWADPLPWVLLGLRTAPREDTGLSPAQAVLGCNLALQEELATLRATREAASGPEARHNTAAHQRAPDTIPDALRTADRVLVRRVLPLSSLYDGPYTVLHRAPRFFTIRMGEREETVHVQRLKPFTAAAEPAAVPPRRGRPPAPPAPPPADAPPRGASSRPGLPLAPPTHCMRFTLPPRDKLTARGRENANPPAEEPGTVFPSDTSEGFFARPGSCPTDDGRRQRLRRPPSHLDL